MTKRLFLLTLLFFIIRTTAAADYPILARNNASGAWGKDSVAISSATVSTTGTLRVQGLDSSTTITAPVFHGKATSADTATSCPLALPFTIFNLSALSDVTISNPSNGQVLGYDGSKWINKTISSGSGGGSTSVYYASIGDGATTTIVHVEDSGPGYLRNIIAYATYNPTQLLFNFDSDVSDAMGNVVTNTGTTINTTVPKFGTGCAYFDGTSSYLQLGSNTNLSFGTGDFTLEFWVYLTTSATSYPTVLSSLSWSSGGAFMRCSTTRIGIYCYNAGYSNDASSAIVACTNIPASAWHHVAITRNGSTMRMFLDGALMSTGTYAGVLNFNNGGGMRMGRDGWNNMSLTGFAGYIDGFRMTKKCTYTSNFSIPTTAPTTLPDKILDCTASVSVAYGDNDQENTSTCTTITNNSGYTATAVVRILP